jgi:hypothetical protein
MKAQSFIELPSNTVLQLAEYTLKSIRACRKQADNATIQLYITHHSKWVNRNPIFNWFFGRAPTWEEAKNILKKPFEDYNFPSEIYKEDLIISNKLRDLAQYAVTQQQDKMQITAEDFTHLRRP